MSKTAIFFSPEGGNVDSVAHKLGELIGNEKADIFPVKEVEKGVFDTNTIKLFLLVLRLEQIIGVTKLL